VADNRTKARFNGGGATPSLRQNFLLPEPGFHWRQRDLRVRLGSQRELPRSKYPRQSRNGITEIRGTARSAMRVLREVVLTARGSS
jgi:hypothetical protein